jgi:hypothetical protein
MGEWFRQRIELSGFRIMRDGQSVTQTWRCPVKLCLVVRVPKFGLERANYWCACVRIRSLVTPYRMLKFVGCDKFALANAGTPNITKC